MNPVTELQWHTGLLKYASMREHGGDIAMAYYRRLLLTRPASVPKVALELVGLPPGYSSAWLLSRRWKAVHDTRHRIHLIDGEIQTTTEYSNE